VPLGSAPPRAIAVVVHDLRQAEAALALEVQHDVAVTLLSAPGAAGYAGVGYLHALSARLGREIVADCRDEAGLVLAGLRTGLRRLVFTGSAETLGRLQDIAGQLGGEVRSRCELPVLELGFDEDPARAFVERGAR
jgi:hypothetical protein